MRSRSLVRHSLIKAFARSRRTSTLPRWLTSKTPTALRTARCSSTTPEYWIGISQPPNSASFAPSATCRSCSGDRRSEASGVTPRHATASVASALMTAVTLTKTTMSDVKADALLIGVAQGPNGPVLVPGAADLDKAFKRKLVAALSTLGATGKANETTKLATLGATSSPQLMAVGLGPVKGKGESYDHETLRRATGTAMRMLAGTKRVATSLALANGGRPEDVRAVTEGALLGGYVFTRYFTETPKTVDAVTVVVDNPRDKAVKAAHAAAQAVGKAVTLARALVNPAPADLGPAELAQAAVDACRAAGCSVEVLDEKALKRGGYGGILGVGQGSSRPPRLAKITYSAGRGAKANVHLVGKGITFDSGGLALKPAASMEWMKSDMGGAAAVVATMQAVATLKPDVDVTGWIA